ncbi:FeoA family protein [Sphingomonas sp.]|uniref:FeoA family protein n=1 Tax=Sphingomonas sp. TaxID=28214 RepID=UPI002DD619F1|nr:FeoA family protein [Sphingomonas sp.]
MTPPPLRLADARRNTPATVAAIDWSALSDAETRRLREFGLDEGVEVELLHGAALGGGPVAARIGRMSITFRNHIARAITVQPAA